MVGIGLVQMKRGSEPFAAAPRPRLDLSHLTKKMFGCSEIFFAPAALEICRVSYTEFPTPKWGITPIDLDDTYG